MSINGLPLEGVRVLDLTHVVSGPYATRYLALLGAEIIKIENPKTQGDMTRRTGPLCGEESVRFASLNHNKKSLALDLSLPEGKEIFAKLIEKCDVIVDNFRPGTLKKLGFSFSKMKKINKRIVYGNLSGFGTEGVYKSEPAYDIIAQALSGMMLLNGEEGMPPAKVGTSIADIIAGLNLVIGILASILKVKNTGIGCFVETNLTDSLVSALMMEYIGCLYTGKAPIRTGNNYREWCPAGAYKSKDGWFVLAIGKEEEYRKLCNVILRNDLAKDENFKNHSLRVENRSLINNAISDWSKDFTTDEICKILKNASVPCAPVLDVPNVICNEHIDGCRNMFKSYSHPKIGDIKVTDIPLRFHDINNISFTPAPSMGENTKDVLKELLQISENKIKESEVSLNDRH